MSHFTVLVVGPDIESQLAPFSENIFVEEYVESTREQLIAKKRKEIEEYNLTTYKHFLSDPEKYKARGEPEWHIRYLEEEFPKKLVMTDEDLYQEAIEDIDKDNIGPNGEVYSIYNPRGKWDWYSIGGRWAGFFKLKKGGFGRQGRHTAKDFAAITGEHVDDLPEDRVDQACKKDIDFDAMVAESREKASKVYDEVISIIGHLPKVKTWREFLLDIDKGNVYSDDARDMYHNQERVVAASNYKKENPERGRELFGWDIEIEDFNLDKDQYVENAGCSAITTFAVLRDGEWFERGSMGWFGAVSDELDSTEWNKKFAELVLNLPGDTLLTVVDCHI